MNEEEVEDGVRECFSSVFSLTEAQEISRFSQEREANWDSVAHVTLVAAIGERFGFEIDFEEAMSVDSFRSAVALVHAELSRRAEQD